MRLRSAKKGRTVTAWTKEWAKSKVLELFMAGRSILEGDETLRCRVHQIHMQN